MPDIDSLTKKRTHSPTPEIPSDELSSSSAEDEDEGEEESMEELVVPDACLACGKEKVTHLTVPCRHPCLCRACAMKMATGGRCKVFASPPFLFVCLVLGLLSILLLCFGFGSWLISLVGMPEYVCGIKED
jgi:hypothetical protein